MTKEEIKRLKDLTMKPSIFASFDKVAELRVEAKTIRAFGGGWNGWTTIKTPADKFIAENLERQASQMEKELIVDLL